MHLRKRGFTLVELLVVIGIIALLISILLPALNKARAAARRAVCLSNQRQLAGALHLYPSQFKGTFPPHLIGVDSYQTGYSYYYGWDDGPGEYEGGFDGSRNWPGRHSADGYVGLGYLVRSGFIKDGRAFYCPDMLQLPVNYLRYDHWETVWDRLRGGKPGTDTLHMGYLYRVFWEKVDPYITESDLVKLNRLKLGKMGKFKGVMALISEYPWWYFDGKGYNVWSHIKPYGLCVAFSDGHGEFVQMGSKNYDAAVDLARKATASNRRDPWLYFFYVWFAIDRSDYLPFAELAAKRDWNGAMKRYGHY